MDTDPIKTCTSSYQPERGEQCLQQSSVGTCHHHESVNHNRMDTKTPCLNHENKHDVSDVDVSVASPNTLQAARSLLDWNHVSTLPPSPTLLQHTVVADSSMRTSRVQEEEDTCQQHERLDASSSKPSSFVVVSSEPSLLQRVHVAEHEKSQDEQSHAVSKLLKLSPSLPLANLANTTITSTMATAADATSDQDWQQQQQQVLSSFDTVLPQVTPPFSPELAPRVRSLARFYALQQQHRQQQQHSIVLSSQSTANEKTDPSMSQLQHKNDTCSTMQSDDEMVVSLSPSFRPVLSQSMPSFRSINEAEDDHDNDDQ